MPMRRKGQLEKLAKKDVLTQNQVISPLFALAASQTRHHPL
jgi:hypothetical protein